MIANRVAFVPSLSYGNSFAVGDKVLKVVNVTDASYRLQDTDYTVSNGILTISESYLKTLEENTEYSFRVFTGNTEFNFKVKTDFAPASVTALKDEYLKGDSVSFTVSDGITVSKVEIDGRECEFTKQNNIITLSADAVSQLIGGEHTVKIYTSKGRPTASFTILGLDDYFEEEIIPVSHVFFYIDIAIFASLILAYAVFAIVKKSKSK